MNPSNDALEVAGSLITAEDVQEEVLRESVETGTESGRTICGNRESYPLDRGFGHVSLPGCSVGKAGMMHGGGGHDLEAPEHSLIDMGIVLFSDASASLVVGKERSDLFLEPDQESAERAVSSFQDVLGVEVSSAEEAAGVVSDMSAGEATRARRQFRRAAGGLFETESTRHEVRPVVDVDPEVASPAVLGSGPTATSGAEDTVRRAFSRIIDLIQSVTSFDIRNVEVNVPQIVLSEVFGALILVLFLKAFGSSPAGLVSP